MTIKIINNNYYYLQIYVYINELIKIIFNYYRKTLKKVFHIAFYVIN